MRFEVADGSNALHDAFATEVRAERSGRRSAERRAKLGWRAEKVERLFFLLRGRDSRQGRLTLRRYSHRRSSSSQVPVSIYLPTYLTSSYGWGVLSSLGNEIRRSTAAEFFQRNVGRGRA